jgi:hypothetical protein
LTFTAWRRSPEVDRSGPRNPIAGPEITTVVSAPAEDRASEGLEGGRQRLAADAAPRAQLQAADPMPSAAELARMSPGSQRLVRELEWMAGGVESMPARKSRKPRGEGQREDSSTAPARTPGGTYLLSTRLPREGRSRAEAPPAPPPSVAATEKPAAGNALPTPGGTYFISSRIPGEHRKVSAPAPSKP